MARTSKYAQLGRTSSRRRKHRLSGYTLTEMLIVLVIIGLIASIVVPQTLGQMDRAKSKAAQLELQHIAAAIELFVSDAHRYPTPAEGLSVLVHKPSGMDDWNGPYLQEQQLKDPWGRPVIYQEPKAAGDSARVGTLGADAKAGGDGPNRDIFIG